MHFFLDHCVPETVAQMLESEGHQAERLREHLPTDTPDDEVINKAQKLSAVLISLNGDFSNIVHFPPSDYKGIISLQVRNRPEAVKIITQKFINYLEVYPTHGHYRGKLLLIEPHRIRVKEGEKQ